MRIADNRCRSVQEPTEEYCCTVSRAARRKACSRRWGWVAWWAAGAILGFSVLGALTVGPLFLPAGIALLGAGILADRRRNQSLFRHLGILVLAGLLQAGLIIGLILLKSPNVQWGFSEGAYWELPEQPKVLDCMVWVAGSKMAGRAGEHVQLPN